jgi:hypothetical protein
MNGAANINDCTGGYFHHRKYELEQTGGCFDANKFFLRGMGYKYKLFPIERVILSEIHAEQFLNSTYYRKNDCFVYVAVNNLSRWVGSDPKTVSEYINGLVKKGLLIKKESRGRLPAGYRIASDKVLEAMTEYGKTFPEETPKLNGQMEDVAYTGNCESVKNNYFDHKEYGLIKTGGFYKASRFFLRAVTEQHELSPIERVILSEIHVEQYLDKYVNHRDEPVSIKIDDFIFWTGAHRRAVIKALNTLVGYGLLIKKESRGRLPAGYRIASDKVLEAMAEYGRKHPEEIPKSKDKPP